MEFISYENDLHKFILEGTYCTCDDVKESEIQLLLHKNPVIRMRKLVHKYHLKN
jgi:hypothetical protein